MPQSDAEPFEGRIGLLLTEEDLSPDVMTAHIPTGPAADRKSGLRAALAARNIRLHSLIRPYDAQAWAHASHGFFKFRDAIPGLLRHISPQGQAELPFL